MAPSRSPELLESNGHAFLLLALTAWAFSAAMLVGSGAAAQTGSDRWTKQLGSTQDLASGPDHRRADAVLRYRLPSQARQGPDQWYLVRLHFEIAFERRAQRGFAYVSALTNGFGAGLVELRYRGGTTGREKVSWRTADLVRGQTDRVVPSRKVEIRFTNYLQYRGVRPGANLLRIKLEQVGLPAVERLTLFGGSGVMVSRRGPPELVIEPTLADDEVEIGNTVELRYNLRNPGGRTARDVAVSLQTEADSVAPAGSKAHTYRRVAGHRQGSFELEALRPGVHSVTLMATGGADPSAVKLDLQIAEGSGWTGYLRLAVGGSLLLLGLCVFFVGRRRSRRQGSGRSVAH